MFKKIAAMSLALVMMLSMFAGCAKKDPVDAGTDGTTPDATTPDSGKEKVLIVRQNGDPQTFNPDVTADDFAYPVVQNLYNRLVKLDASKQIIPDAAKEWEVSEDGMSITFKLFDNIKWHDGEPLTADDVVYTFTTIKNTPEYFLCANLGDVDTIEKVDDYTVKFNMKTPNVALVGYLGWYGCFILPKHIFDNGTPWTENEQCKNPTVGSGPFKFSEFKPGVSITIVKNAEYFEAEPKLDKVVFSIIPDSTTAVQALKNGEIDILTSIPDAEYKAMSTDPNIRLAANIYPSPAYIAFNMKEEAVQDVAVRTALAMCIDREAIAEKVFQGIRSPEYNMYPAVVDWASNSQDTAPKFDIDGAIKVLEDAGYKKDANGYYVAGLPYDVFQDGGHPDIAKLIQADAKKAGIELVLNVQEFNAWNQKVFVERNFVVEMQGGFQGPDPAALGARVCTGGAMNQSSYSNAEVDALFAEAAKTGDQAKRAELYKKAQAILAKELPIVPIVNYASYDACGANITDTPTDGAGKWGWGEFTYTDIK